MVYLGALVRFLEEYSFRSTWQINGSVKPLIKQKEWKQIDITFTFKKKRLPDLV